MGLLVKSEVWKEKPMGTTLSETKLPSEKEGVDFKIDIVFGDHKPLNEFSDYEWELLREHNPANYAAYQTDLLKRRSDYLYAIEGGAICAVAFWLLMYIW
jgi:hypothetical protein